MQSGAVVVSAFLTFHQDLVNFLKGLSSHGHLFLSADLPAAEQMPISKEEPCHVAILVVSANSKAEKQLAKKPTFR